MLIRSMTARTIRPTITQISIAMPNISPPLPISKTYEGLHPQGHEGSQRNLRFILAELERLPGSALLPPGRELCVPARGVLRKLRPRSSGYEHPNCTRRKLDDCRSRECRSRGVDSSLPPRIA